MTFTYEYDLANVPRDRIRFEVGDTGEKDDAGNLIQNSWFLEDEEILGLLSIHSDDWQQTALACIRAIIGKLSRPAFSADWLKVDPKVAIDSYRKLLAEKQAEYGVSLGENYGGWFESGSTDVTRSDVEETDYVPPQV